MRTKRSRLTVGAAVLAVLAAASVVLVVIGVLPTLSWWPGWLVVGRWWATWWPAVTAVVATTGALVLWRYRKAVAAEPTAGGENRASPLWVRGPKGAGWVRRPVGAATISAVSTHALPAKEWDWAKFSAAVTAFTALAALVFTSQSLAATRQQNEQTQQSINQAEQGQVTDRYTTAVDQIGAEDSPGQSHLETRLGGVYALERLMADSPRDQPTIVEVLSAFIRSSAPMPTSGPCTDYPPKLDVQAALTVLARRSPAQDQDSAIDLSSTCLPGANFTNTTPIPIGVTLRPGNFSHADLVGADLSEAQLEDANLSGAFLGHANLTGANLQGANLRYAFLPTANLTGAHLDSASLESANLAESTLHIATLNFATLTTADLDSADLSGADFEAANLNLASLRYASLDGAIFGEASVAGADFRGALDINLNGATGTPTR